MAAEEDDQPESETDPTEAAFAHWLRPWEVLELKGGMTAGEAVKALLIRMKGGVLIATAGLAKWVSDGKPVEARMCRFPHEWWHLASVSASHESFWKVPVADIHVNPPRGNGHPLFFFDVRFDPDGARALFGLPPASDPPINAPPLSRAAERVSEPRKGGVPDQEVKAWYVALPADQQTLGILKLWALANEAHYPRNVARKQIEHFGKDRPTGRPKRV